METTINEAVETTDFTIPVLTDSTNLDSLINHAMLYYRIPGLTALINAKENGTIWKRNYGLANIDLNLAVEDSTIFRIASISKTIVATAIMQFWEADSFDLDDNINNYLDGFQIINPYRPNDTITIRMLMTHTSTIRDNWPVLHSLVCCGDSPITLDSFLVNYLTPGGSYYDPNNNFYNALTGSEWQYSNVAVSILALMVEKFAGLSFAQYCYKNIFEPLEMFKTYWFLDGLDTTSIATPYLWQGNQYFSYCHHGRPSYPSGQLRTTKIELEHLLSMYMNWGKYNETAILDSSTVDLMLSDHLGNPTPEGTKQGLIWYQLSDPEGRCFWGHAGLTEGYRSGMFFMQDEDWGTIMFMNSAPTDQAVFYLFDLLSDHAQNITDVAEIINPISNFYLFQNFPNPFNPFTKIRYSVPHISNVSIKVFDILGNEIEILVKEEKPAGTYEVIWNAENLPSGVYFYKLQAGSFVETKKMILLR
jgi:CubicO group peptidase (beta-lactamase class C family)